MVLIYTQKITPRITYIFKHICTRILGLEVSFTAAIEELIAHNGAKLSYGKKPMGNELFLQSHGLLTDQGIESLEITVKEWENTKCFFAVGEKSELPFDIFAASFYLLSRYEEYLPHVKDDLGRYPASESLGYKEDFLQQPVIDMWAYQFKQALTAHFPQLLFTAKRKKIHTLIEARQPFAYKQKGFFRSMVGAVNDLADFKVKAFGQRLQVVAGLRRDPLDVFKWIITNAKRSDTKLTVFFLLGENPVFEESLNTRRQRFKMLIKFISDYKEVGLIFSSASLRNYELQKIEKRRMEEITNKPLSGSLNAQYRIDLPDIYRNLVELEVEKDFTMLYEDTVGFRAGTCTPFLYYDLDYEIKTPLIVHPVATTTYAFKNKNEAEINSRIDALLECVETVNGTFSMLFSNRDFSFYGKTKIWRDVFSEKLQ